MSDVISQESFDELALYFNGGGHLLTPDARRSAAERARILCAYGIDALRQYTHRTGMTVHYYVAPYDTSDLLRTGANALAVHRLRPARCALPVGKLAPAHAPRRVNVG